MKRKFLIVILCLVFFGLACLSTSMSAAVVDQPTEMATRLFELATSTAAAIVISPTSTARPQLCAVVIADTAVHLRTAATETARSIDHLVNGEVVYIESKGSGEWWMVHHQGMIGFVKAKYLKESECVK